MKLGEIIDYMMENEIVSAIKTNDGKHFIKGEKYNPLTDVTNSEYFYILTVSHSTGDNLYQFLELSKSDWEEINYSTDKQISPDKSYRLLSYVYEDVFGNHKRSVKEFNSLANINRRCRYNGDNLIMINLH